MPSQSDVEFVLNGTPVRAEGQPPHRTLLQFIRNQGLTGAKEVCAEGECGACTVLQVVDSAAGTTLRAVNSCLVFLSAVAGQEIYTVEAVASNGKLAEAQTALASAGGSQCGYCTPGFVMSLVAEQHRPERTGTCDPAALSGNLCRCTGYRPIRDAALAVGPPAEGKFSDRLRKPAPLLKAVETTHASGRFSRPETLDGCLATLAADPEAKLLAGGTDLGVESNLHGQRWTHLVSVEAIPELQEFTLTDRFVRIGSALPLAELAVRWRSAPPIIREWLRLFGSPQIRNRATLGGNLGTASPVGDAAPLLMALDATAGIAGLAERRVVPVASLFVGYRRTILAPEELITSIEIPLPFPQFSRFYKVARRRLDDISTVAAGMSFDLNPDSTIARARIAFGGMAAKPILLSSAESAMIGQPPNEYVRSRVGSLIDEELRPLSDSRGSANYRSAVAGSLLEKFLWEWRTTAQAA